MLALFIAVALVVAIELACAIYLHVDDWRKTRGEWWSAAVIAEKCWFFDDALVVRHFGFPNAQGEHRVSKASLAAWQRPLVLRIAESPIVTLFSALGFGSACFLYPGMPEFAVYTIVAIAALRIVIGLSVFQLTNQATQDSPTWDELGFVPNECNPDPCIRYFEPADTVEPNHEGDAT